MRYVIVEHGSLATSDRWAPSFFFETAPFSSRYPMVELRRLVSERVGSVDPQTMGDSQVAYLGLENIRSHTGELVDFSLRLASTVKSRSKRFQPGDILFGRLRPELNKVYLVEGEPSHGICSGELLVLAPNASVANGVYVRHVLASAFVASCIKKFRAGASLPRISAQDLLSIRVPLAPLDVQEEIAKRLSEIDSQLKSLRRRIEELPRRQKEVLMLAVGSGSDRDGEY